MKKPADWRQFLKGEPQKVELNGASPRWWTDKDPAASILSVVTSLHQNQQPRLSQMRNEARLYGNLTTLGPLGSLLGNMARLRPAQPGKSTYNVVQSVIDTVTAKIAKSKPEPLFLTSGGNFHQQRRAQKLTDWVGGVLYENKAHAMAVQAFRDACVWGDGLVYVYPSNGRVCLERVLPAELFIDEVEGFYREPRQIHWVKLRDLDTLVEAFPKSAQALYAQDPAKVANPVYGYTNADLRQVIESWHLPSGPEADDGKHTIICGDVVLLEEEWEHDFFPFAKIAWAPRQYGFWSQSLVEQLQGIQMEINQLSWVAQRSFYMAGSFKILVKTGSKIVKEHLNNDVGSIVNWAGDTPPAYITPPIIQPEHLARIETLKQSAYEQAGISQLSASSQKPAGLNSGRALREMTDIESDRFTVVGQAFEQFFLDLAKLIVATAESIDDGELRVRMPGRRALKTLDFSECRMDAEQFVTKCFPVSALPKEPAGRLQTVQEMVQAGFISPERGRRLLDFPDLDAEEGLGNAQLEYLHSLFDGIVDEGKPGQIESYDDLAEARRLALQYYSLGKSSDLEEDRLQMLRDLIDQIDTMTAEAAPPAGGGPSPQAVAAPPPVSDLIPNVPQQ
jgi:hypothetical protein